MSRAGSRFYRGEGAPEFVEPGAGHGAQGDGPGRGQGGDDRKPVFEFLQGQQVRFGQEDDRLHLSVRGHEQVSFQPVGVEVEMA